MQVFLLNHTIKDAMSERDVPELNRLPQKQTVQSNLGTVL